MRDLDGEQRPASAIDRLPTTAPRTNGPTRALGNADRSGGYLGAASPGNTSRPLAECPSVAVVPVTGWKVSRFSAPNMDDRWIKGLDLDDVIALSDNQTTESAPQLTRFVDHVTSLARTPRTSKVTVVVSERRVQSITAGFERLVSAVLNGATPRASGTRRRRLLVAARGHHF